ncbi:MAG: helix-turn-helix transcriptional regulator [Ruminococcaceae bacterium]|nr:helix-turn-helix transcriptional regulator [Oscillospiraceae bacterium]
MFDFGLRIRKLREQHKLSQEQLGEKVERSKSVISNYENNIKIPPLEILVNLAVIFNVSLDYLVGIDKNEMISIEGLTDNQKKILQTVVFEFKDKGRYREGLTERQQEILNGLIKEFSKKK